MVDTQFKTRLSQLIDGFGSVAEMARAIGVSNNAIYKWLAGVGQPNVSNLVALARVARVSVEWLATGRDPAATECHARASGERSEYTYLPRHDVRLASGRGAPIRSKQVVDSLAFRTDWINQRLGVEPRNLILVEVAGDSMSPTFNDSDLLLVDLSDPRFKQDGVYVLRSDGELVVKRLQRRLDGKLIIRSDNPAYETTVVARDGLGIVGRVVWSAGRR